MLRDPPPPACVLIAAAAVLAAAGLAACAELKPGSDRADAATSDVVSEPAGDLPADPADAAADAARDLPLDTSAPDAPPDLPCPTEGLTYQVDIDPIVLRNCAIACHEDSGGFDPRLRVGDAMNNWQRLGGEAIPEQTSGIGFVDSDQHGGGPVLDSDSCEMRQIRAWVAAGAPF